MKEAGSMEIGTHDSGGFLSNQIEMLDLDNCNRDFSASSTSQDKNAYIGIRLVEEQSTGDDLFGTLPDRLQVPVFLSRLADQWLYLQCGASHDNIGREVICCFI